MPEICNVIINVWGSPGLIASLINPRARISYNGADWQPIKHYAWGVVGFDPEEGIRLETTTKELVRCIRWFRRWAAKHDFPVEYGGKHQVQATLCNLPPPENIAQAFDPKQWVPYTEISWNLRAEPLNS